MNEPVLLALVTCPSAAAAELARQLVEGRYAACVNIVPGIESVYRWQGQVESNREALLLIKTTAARMEALKEAVLRGHPYELPEIIAVTVTQGHLPYLDWIREGTRA